MSYRMVAAIQQATSEILPDLFSNLLHYGVFPAAWKVAKCVPIPKPGRTDTTDPKNLRPISLLSCLGKTLVKILATRLVQASQATGAITAEQYGSLPQRASIDALMTNLTDAQQLARMPNTHRTLAIRPSLLANDIDGAFNCVSHPRLINILTHYRFPEPLVRIIADFNSGRRIYLTFDGKHEEPVPFQAGISQGSPLSPILFVIYTAGLTNLGPQPHLRQFTSYVDDKVMTQGTNTQKAAVRVLQTRLDERI